MIYRKPSSYLVIAIVLGITIGGVLPETSAARKSRSSRGVYKSWEPGKRLTVQQATAIALKRNLQLKIDELEIEQSRQSSYAAYSDLFPSLSLEYVAYADRYQNIGLSEELADAQDARWTFRDGFGRGSGLPQAIIPTYPYRADPYRLFELTATLTQPIYSGGNLLNTYKAAKLDVDSETLQLQIDKQDLMLEVYEAYYDLLLGEKLLEVAKQSVKDLEAVKHQAEEFYKAQVALKVDVLAAEGALANTKLLYNSAISDINTARATLNYLLRFPQETPTQIVQDLAFKPLPYKTPTIYTIARNNRLEIVQADVEARQATAEAKASEGGLGPTIELEISGSRSNDNWNPLDWEGYNDWSIEGVVSWTFNMFRNKATVKADRAAQAESFVNKELLEEQIMEDVKQAYVAAQKSEADLRDLRKEVEYRREQYWMNKEQYKQQLATYIEVLDGQRQLTLAKGNYYNALIQYKIDLATLERQMGVLR